MTAAEEYGPSDHHDNPYDLTEEKLRELTGRLLAERPPEGSDRFVCYKLEGDDAFASIGRKIESDVFGEAFNNSPDEMEAEYGPYEQQSMFFVTIDREKGIPTGAMRIIKDGPQGFKSLNDFLEKSPSVTAEDVREFHGMHDDEHTWDVATVAVPPEYRDKGTATQLYRAMYKTAVDDGIEHVVAIIDADPLKKMNKFLGIPLVPMVDSEPFPYIGSQKSQAVYGRISEFDREMTRHRRRSVRGFLARAAIHRLLGESDDSDKGLQF
jgi:GNAT superfamily N-acetyltransferase